MDFFYLPPPLSSLFLRQRSVLRLSYFPLAFVSSYSYGFDLYTNIFPTKSDDLTRLLFSCVFCLSETISELLNNQVIFQPGFVDREISLVRLLISHNLYS